MLMALVMSFLSHTTPLRDGISVCMDCLLLCQDLHGVKYKEIINCKFISICIYK